jgi:hypothetical protein
MGYINPVLWTGQDEPRSTLRNTIYRVRLGFDSRYIFLDFLLVVIAYNNPDVTSVRMVHTGLHSNTEHFACCLHFGFK